MDSQVQQIVRKLALLTPERLAEAEDFIDFLRQRQSKSDDALARDFTCASEKTFAEVWDNEEDAVYDA